MRNIFNRAVMKERRRTLRHRMTTAEVILWSRLKNKQLDGYKFRRQYSVDNYIVDFYCPRLRVAIEVDGEIHFSSDERIAYDKARQLHIESYGIRFIRVQNHQVFEDVDSVIETIAREIEIASAPQPPPRFSLKKEGIREIS